MFKKYQHIEKLYTEETEGILLGKCYIFPKIDGTNSSVWREEGEIKAGSRNRELSIEEDNAGFFSWVQTQENIKKYLEKNPTRRLYGEWLIPHSLKTYRKEAWKQFYVFDVMEEGEYLPYEEYKTSLVEFDIAFIPPLVVTSCLTEDTIKRILEKNKYLIQDGEGTGEGVVVKNYEYRNKFGKKIWGKLITNEFKEKHLKVMGETYEGKLSPEEKMIEKHCTDSLIEKEYSKILLEVGEWENTLMIRLLNTVFYCLIKEELYDFLKKNKNPTIDFKKLNFLSNEKVKDFLKKVLTS